MIEISNVLDRFSPINGHAITSVIVTDNHQHFPVIELDEIPKEEWNRRAREQALKHFRQFVGREPINANEAVEWHRGFAGVR